MATELTELSQESSESSVKTSVDNSVNASLMESYSYPLKIDNSVSKKGVRKRGDFVRERERITELYELFSVPLSWAISRRVEYLTQKLAASGDEIERLTHLQGKCRNEAERLLVSHGLEDAFKEYRRIERQIKTLKYEEPKAGITNDMIERARSYPMAELMGVQRKGNVSCPFHDDKHPSASIKNNRLHCFSCNKTWNPLDYVIEKEGISFQEAMLRLNGIG